MYPYSKITLDTYYNIIVLRNAGHVRYAIFTTFYPQQWVRDNFIRIYTLQPQTLNVKFTGLLCLFCFYHV